MRRRQILSRQSRQSAPDPSGAAVSGPAAAQTELSPPVSRRTQAKRPMLTLKDKR